MFDIISRTFLIERVIGIGCYLFLTIITYNSIATDDAKLIKFNLKKCVLFLVVLAFFFVPDEHKDLYRILEMTKNWAKLSLSEFLNSNIIESPSAIGFFYYYACRKIPYDGALPAITALLFYTNTFWIIMKLLDNEKLRKESIALAFLFFMSAGSFLEVISDIRNFLAFSIVFRCFCKEWLDGKSIFLNIPFYFISALMHSTVIPLLAIRLIYFIIFENNTSVIKKFISISFLSVIIVIFYFKFTNTISSSYNKALHFLSGDTYSYIWEYVIGIIQWITIAVLTHKLSNNVKTYGSSTGLLHINRMAKIILFIEAIFVFEYNIFHRFILVSLFLSIPQISFYLSNIKNEKIINSFKLICYIIFIIVCSRGNLCGYKFFVLN